MDFKQGSALAVSCGTSSWSPKPTAGEDRLLAVANWCFASPNIGRYYGEQDTPKSMVVFTVASYT